MIKMSRACSQSEEDRSSFKMLTGKTYREENFGSPRLRWEDNFRTDLKGIDINKSD